MTNERVAINPQPFPPREIAVHVPIEVLHDLERLQKVQSSVLGKLGCQACCSGFDIRWQAFDEFVVTSDLEVRAAHELGFGR